MTKYINIIKSESYTNMGLHFFNATNPMASVHRLISVTENTNTRLVNPAEELP